MVNGANHTGHTSNKNTLWIAGWMWGKYPEQAQTYQLPQDETEAVEWLEGFRWGTTEACQFHRLWEWLDETLAVLVAAATVVLFLVIAAVLTSGIY